MFWLRFWYSIICGKRSVNIFCFKSHHIITMSRQWDLQWYTLPLTANNRPGQTAFSPRQTHTKDTPYNNIIVFGLVTWLCWLKCRIFLDRQVSPTQRPFSLFQPEKSQFQSVMPDQDNQVLSVEWAESLVWTQANTISLSPLIYPPLPLVLCKNINTTWCWLADIVLCCSAISFSWKRS